MVLEIASSHHTFKRIVSFHEEMNQCHTNMTNNQNGQNPCDWRMELSQGLGPGNFLAFSKKLDTESRNPVATTQHDHYPGYRHQQQAKIQRPMTGLDQQSLRRILLRALMTLASGPGQAYQNLLAASSLESISSGSDNFTEANISSS